MMGHAPAAAPAEEQTSSSSCSCDDPNPHSAQQQQLIRIACLIPSATDICIALELTDNIVGITHECYNNYPNLFNNNKELVSILTIDRIHEDTNNNDTTTPATTTKTQKEINDLVEENSKQAMEAILASSTTSSSCDESREIPSLYPLQRDAFTKSKPTLVITQDLCNVCAPSSDAVRKVIVDNNNNNNNNNNNESPITEAQIISLTPNTLDDVLDNITTVADACGVSERGQKFRAKILEQLNLIQLTVNNNRTMPSQPQPTMFVLEWLDPPYDGGHWIPYMMEYAGVRSAVVSNNKNHKSQKLQWNEVEKANADVVMIACCGFNLQRNIQDAYTAREHLIKLRATKEGRIFATDGDKYFARPGPQLLQGVAIMALCAYHDQPQVIEALKQLPFIDKAFDAYKKLDFSSSSSSASISTVKMAEEEKKATPPPEGVLDIEDFHIVHQRACKANEKFYIDPKTGYSVFTEMAHLQRGKCCGSGCRHCPYSHENVSPNDKATKIQQPAFLYNGDDDNSNNNNILGLHHGNIRVLFFSGGKDSYLTIRALAREALASKSPFGLVLLTTFDAISREIAHQEVNVCQVQRQAEHLGLALVGVPIHRGTTESYDQRIRRALDVIETHTKQTVKALVFGDLHLEHVYKWRQDNMGSSLGTYDLQFPLWKVDYKVLEEDLEKSGVKCIVSASTIDGVVAGDVYDRAFRERIRRGELGKKIDNDTTSSSGNNNSNNDNNVDLFGENGEFHTLANVWSVSRKQALGIE